MTTALEAEKEYAGLREASDAANRSAMQDNFRAGALLKHQKAMKELGAGLKACVSSGLSREKIIELVNAVFDDAGKA